MSLGGSDHVIVVGAGLAGWRLVESLRHDGYDGALSLVGDEPEVPYDRPPLSKQVLRGAWDLEQTVLGTAQRLESARVTLRLGVPARHLDVAATTLHLEDGTTIAGTHVAIATGSRARRLDFSAAERVHVLRTRAHAARLLAELDALGPGRIAVVIGGGFIGAEVATALASRGLRVIVLERLRRPLLGPLGPVVAEWLANLASAAGVDLRVEQEVLDVTEDAGALVVHLGDGSSITAGLVVLGAGSQANVEWLATSGLSIDDGVVVDDRLQATERVAAIGDVARFTWHGPLGAQLVRIEHWQVAADHAAALSRVWVRAQEPGPLVPYFWSDQYGTKIQMLGHPQGDDDVVRVLERDGGARWLGVYSRRGIVSGIVALGLPRALTLSRTLIETPTSLEVALRHAPWSA